MRSPAVLDIAECLAQIDRFDSIIDARSPSEFALDHLPGAINLPVLDDAERALVGTTNAQRSPFEAKRLGAGLVCRRIEGILTNHLSDRGPTWRPLVYCWRGGNRSGSLATVLSRIGWRTTVIDGGYRAFRRHVVAEMPLRIAALRFVVLAGRTGTAKSLVLARLRARGLQALDLEQLARHRGSVLGAIPDQPQPTQKAFETGLWSALRSFDPSRPVFVESESRRIGSCQLPGPLIEAIRGSPCTVLEPPLDFRIGFLRGQYEHLSASPALLAERLETLTHMHGRERIAHWTGLARQGRIDELIEALLSEHYDPAYDRSMARNFTRLDQATVIHPDPSIFVRADTTPAIIDSMALAVQSAAGDAIARAP